MNSKSSLTIGSGSAAQFFRRGRDHARAADRGTALGPALTITFEDPIDLARFLSPVRVTLIKEVKHSPNSVSGLAKRLRRDVSAVRRDVKKLEEAGLVQVVTTTNPGHGKMRIVESRVSGRLTFSASLD
jgi:predicted transcriptional regulator